MGYVCLSCYEEYNKDTLNLNWCDDEQYKCPKSNCGDLNVVEIDDLLLPIIKELNQKGYMTEFCCSGHNYDYENDYCNTYISFQEDCLPNIIPDGFVVEDKEYYEKQNWDLLKFYNEDMICIRKRHKGFNNELDLHKNLLKTIDGLIEWVKKLEYLN